jgi:integrase
MTFREQSAIYLAQIKARRRNPLKPTSLATISSLIETAKPFIGEMPLEQIHNGSLKSLVAILDKTYRPNTIQSILLTIKQVVASDRDEVTREPKHLRAWDDNEIDAPPVQQQDKHVPSAKEIESAIAKSRSPFREFLVVQAATGARKGELCALSVSDFDAENGFLRVSQTQSQYGVTSTKTRNGKRQIDIAPEIVRVLNAMLAGRTEGSLFKLSLAQVRYAYEQLGIRSHRLRYFRYQHLENKNVLPRVRAYWIGHSMGKLAQIYGRIQENNEDDTRLRHRIAQEIGIGFRLPEFAATTEPALEAEAVSA